MKFIERFINGTRRHLCFAVNIGGGGGGDPGSGGGTPAEGSVGLSGGSGGSAGTVEMQSPMAVQQLRVGAVLHTIPVPVPTPGQPVNGPTFPILPGYYVEVSPIPGNAGAAFFSRVSRQAAVGGPREQVVNNAVPRQIDVRDLSELWINAANAGEGVQFTVRRNV